MEDKTTKDFIEEALKSFADTIGVATSGIWNIFVREYLVRGAVQLMITSVFLLLYFNLKVPVPYWELWSQLLLLPAVGFASVGLRLVLNPGYHAINELSSVVKEYLLKPRY